MSDLEIELESGEFEGESIEKLLEAYEQAVNFYNMKNDTKRSRVYENKLQNLMVNPAIMMALASA
jgi:hypothetical protein